LYKNQDIGVLKKKKDWISIIDLGYNSAKISIYNIYKNGHYLKKRQYQDYIQIGHNLLKNNNIIESNNIERVIKFLNNFKNESKELKLDTVIPIATSAVRDADNGNDVVKRIKKWTGFEFNVLSGLEEGFFSYLGAQSSMNIPNGIFFDLGGGSIEIIHVENFKIKKIICLDLGVLRLFDNFVNLDGKLETTQSNYAQLEDYLVKNMPTKDQFNIDHLADYKLVGVGGTIRTIYKFVSGIFKIIPSFSYDSSHIALTKKMIDLSNNVFKGLSQEELLRIKLIDPRRAKTIAIGSYIIKILMENLGFDDLLVCTSGLREGILENYLYLNMNKKYRLKKKFIELNYGGLSSIEYSSYINRIQTNEQKKQQLEEQEDEVDNDRQYNKNNNSFAKVLYEPYRENFPLKIGISKLNKLQ
jgi:exopolyphosphatase / guanosine-5'-triphosphate,3'-diphosphate pyrophosphatase